MSFSPHTDSLAPASGAARLLPTLGQAAAPVRLRPSIVPPVLPRAPQPRQFGRGASFIFFLVNALLLVVLALGIFSWVNVEISADQKSAETGQLKSQTESLEHQKEAWEKYVSEMKKGFSDLLMNETRERAAVKLEGEGVLPLHEEF
jgi:uncharacterized protein HemX